MVDDPAPDFATDGGFPKSVSRELAHVTDPSVISLSVYETRVIAGRRGGD